MGNCMQPSSVSPTTTLSSSTTSKNKTRAQIQEEEWVHKLEQDRREGRALLRQMVVKSDDVDWKAVIEQADTLHQKQQQKLKKQELRHLRKERKRALEERKKVDAVGSFSVNLLTMKHSDEDNNAVLRWRVSRRCSNSTSGLHPNVRHRSDATATATVDEDSRGGCEDDEEEDLDLEVRVHSMGEQEV